MTEGKKMLPLREKVVFGETSLNVTSLFLAWLFAGLCHLCLITLSSSPQKLTLREKLFWFCTFEARIEPNRPSQIATSLMN